MRYLRVFEVRAKNERERVSKRQRIDQEQERVTSSRNPFKGPKEGTLKKKHDGDRKSRAKVRARTKVPNKRAQILQNVPYTIP